MMWQDFVFMAGSMLSIVFLAPTLRDAKSRVPLSTCAPSMLIGAAYGTTFLTLGMSFSAFGAFAAATMWSLIGWFRSPRLAGADLSPELAWTMPSPIVAAKRLTRQLLYSVPHRLTHQLSEYVRRVTIGDR